MPGARLDRLAAAAFLLWCLGAAASHRIGLWPGIGGPAVALGVMAIVREPELLGSLLRPTALRVCTGLLGAAVMLVATYALYPIAAHALPWLAARTGELYVFFNSAPALVPYLLVPVAVVGEEVVWRGIVQESLSRRLGRGGAAVAAACAYALAHAPAGSVLLTLIALTCGLYWSALRASTGSLLPSLLAHMLWDAAVMLLLPLVRAG